MTKNALLRAQLRDLLDGPPDPAIWTYAERVGEADRAVVDRYATKLTKDLVDVVGASLREMKPAKLEFGNGAAHFGIKQGDVVLMCGFGAGLTWGTALFRW